MGFLLRAFFVVGVIYVLSPLRTELPDWLIDPVPEAAREVKPVLAEAAKDALVATCKAHEAGCANAAKHIAGAVVANNDAQAAFEALVKQAAAMPMPQAETQTPPPASITALIEKQPAHKPSPALGAEAPLGLTIIPLPPRRKI